MLHPTLAAPLFALFAGSTLFTLGMAVAVLRGHAVVRARNERERHEGDELALEFARFLSRPDDPAHLRARAEAARPSVFWRALETFSDGIEGEEWRTLTAQLRGLSEIERVRHRLGRGSAWSRALVARRVGLLEDPAHRRALFTAMTGGPALVSLTAGLALARLHDTGALEWLIQHPEALAGMSRHQLVALIKRFGPAGLEPLRRAAALEPSEAPMRLAALDALGLWKDTAARARLETLLTAGALETRAAAARALGQIAAAASLPALDAALRDRAWQVRAQAAHALGALGEAALSSVPTLAARARDLSWWVRRHAAYALGRMGLTGQQALATIAAHDQDPYARDAAQEVLQMIDWERESPGGQARVE